MGKTILIATQKPFAKEAITIIQNIIKDSPGFEARILENYQHPKDLKEAIGEVDALIIRSDKVTRAIIETARNLKIIVRAGTGYDNIDIEAANERGIVVMNTPGQNANAVAELAFGLMLGLIRNKYNGQPGTELKGKKIGMHGFGNIGKSMATIAKGFGMDVCAYDRRNDRYEFSENNVNKCSSIDELYSTCDIVSINIPANEKTIGSINYELLSKTKENVLIINSARKELVNEDDLLRIMEERDGFKYTSDFAPSCMDLMTKKYPMRTLFTTNKMGAQTAEANINAGVAAAKQIIDYFNNGVITFKIN